jgi:hypothetical protein
MIVAFKLVFRSPTQHPNLPLSNHRVKIPYHAPVGHNLKELNNSHSRKQHLVSPLVNILHSHYNHPSKTTDVNIKMNDITILNDETRNLLLSIFRRPVSSENIFLLTNLLKTSNQSTIREIFTVYLKWLEESIRSKITKPPEMLASQGIYLCMILRHVSLSALSAELLYPEGRHFMLLGWKAYYPYVPMFIIYFLIPCIVSGLDPEAPWRCDNTSSSSSDSSPRLESNRPSSPSSTTSILTRQHSAETLEQINRIREGVNSPPLRTSASDSDLSPASVPRNSPQKPKEISSIILKLIEQCPLNSPERQSLSELRRVYGSGYNYYCSRLGIQQQKTELAIFLDVPAMLDAPLSEDDIQKAIFMHSNAILKADVNFLPHHFDRAVRCLNYEIAKETEGLADWVKPESLEELIFLCKELKHAVCRELLLIVIKKNVTLCGHQLKRLPEAWREPILQLYTTPRWKYCLSNPSNDTICEATLDYYRLNLCHNADQANFIAKVAELAEKLSNPITVETFLKRINDTNRSFYALQLCGYDDLETIDKLSFANEQDSNLNDIFDISRNFIFPYRVDNHIYLFDYNHVPSMLKTKQNPFTRGSLSTELLDEMANRHHKYNAMGLGITCVSMTDFVKELVYGRRIETVCGCASRKTYVIKLARSLRGYGVKVEHFETVDLRDAIFKVGLLGIDHGRPDSIEKFSSNLYRLLKNSDGTVRESLKQGISSVIMMYR